MSTLFARRWEHFLKKPGQRPLSKLEEVLEDATPEEALQVIERSLAWITQILDVPGCKTLREAWRRPLLTAFARIHTGQHGADHAAHYALLQKSLPLAQRAQEMLAPDAPSLMVWNIQEALKAFDS